MDNKKIDNLLASKVDRSFVISGGSMMSRPVSENLIITEETLPVITQLAESIPGGFFIYHADGDQELIYFNSHLPAIFGCENDEEFKELTGNSFKGIVHPDDYVRSESAIQEQIKDGKGNIDHVKYRIIRKDGSIAMLDDYGHFSHSDTLGDIYYVFVQDVTKGWREEQKAAQMEILNQMLLDYDGVFLIDCVNDTRRTFHDRLAGAAKYDDAEKYSTLFSQYVENCVCEPDYELMKGFVKPANILKNLGDRNDMTVTYRDKTTGTQRFYQMRIVRFSDTEVLQSFRENDAEMVNSFLFEKLKDNYYAIFGVDLETGVMRSYKDDPLHIAGKEGEISTLSSTMLNLASHFEGETKTFFERNSDVNYIRERFAKEDRAEFIYKSPLKDGKWSDVTGFVFERKEDGTPSLFCFAFNYLDEEAAKLQELQAELNAESQRSSMFFDAFDAGKWSYEISANDEIISADYSDGVHRSTNISSYSGKPMGWIERVYPEDREATLEKFMAAVHDHTAETKYDVDFRIIGSDGNIRWTKSAGRVMRRSDGTGKFFGMNIDITDEVEEQEEYLAQKAVADQFISNFIRDYGTVFRVNVNDYSCSLLKMDENMRTRELTYSDFREAISYFLDNIVYKADKSRVRRKLDFGFMRNELAKDSSYSIEYRVNTGSEVRWDEMKISILDDTYVAVGFAIKNREIILSHLQEKEYENYYAMFAIDIDAEQITNIKNDSKYATGTVGSVAPYSVVMKAFANSLEGDAKEFFLHMSDIENVRKIHAVEDKLTYVYQSVLDDEKRWIRATSYAVIRHDDGSPAVAALGFNFMDSMSAERQDMAEELARMTAVANYFVKSYSSAYYCDIKTGEVVILHTNPELANRIAGSVLSYNSLLSVYSSDFVHPDDRETVRLAFNDENIRKQLEDAEEFSFTFRVVSHRAPGIYRGTVIRGADENHIGVGFRNVSEEVRKEQETNRIDSLIKTFAKEYEAVFIANLNDGSYQTVTNIKEISEIFNGKGSFTEALNRFNTEMMHPLDRERAESERIPLDKTGEGIEVGESHSVEFRCRTGDGYSWYRGTMSRLSEDMLMVGFKDCNEEKIFRLVEDVIIGEFDALYMVNLDLDEIRPVRASRISKVGNISGKLVYSDLCRRFAETVAPQYREDWICFSKIDYMKQYMAELDRREYVYELPEAGNAMRRFTVNVVERADGEAVTLLLSFTGIDDARADAIRLHRQLADKTVELEEKSEQLEEALNEAQYANRAKTDFLFNMSHDIRTPMNAIIGFTDRVIKNRDNPTVVDESLKKLKSSSEYMLQIVNDILDMARIESGRLEIREDLRYLEDGSNAMIEIMAAEADRKDIRFHASYNVKDKYIWVDHGHSSQIVANILSNSIKYTKPGGNIWYSVEQVPCDRPGYGKYVVSVKDTGIGMSPEFIEKIFEPFEREQTSTVSGVQGTGLGMAIVKRIVDAMGGTIEIHSEPGVGTEVVFTSEHRLATLEEIEQYNLNAKKENKGITSFEGLRILLVEDNDLNREIATDILDEEGITVESAEDGSIAVEILKEKGPDYYDFILMDIQMPVMNGYEATEAIRAMYPDSKLPIIAVSANAFDEDRKASKEAGMDGHIAKPINVKELFEALARYL